MRLLLLTLLPKNLVSRLAGWFASSGLSRFIIKPFASFYKIDLAEAEFPIESYRTLNAFFTRRLKPGVRKIEGDDQTLVSPVDGKLVEFGPIEKNKLIQAKGIDFTLEQFLGSKSEAAPFIDGFFMTIYLAPVDYHRIHHYTDGEITRYTYIPGTLFPVNNFSVQRVPQLFAINERITTTVTQGERTSAIVKVGATIVGKIKVAYDSIESNCGRKMTSHTYERPIRVTKGEELGLFQMGSTVVLLFEKDSFKMNSFSKGDRVQLGMTLGQWV